MMDHVVRSGGRVSRHLALLLTVALAASALVAANVSPASAQEQDAVKILVLSKNPGHGAASVAAANTVRELAEDIAGDGGFAVEVDETTSTGQFSDASFLEQYDAVVFNYTSGMVFDNQAQRDGFQSYIQDGGAFVGLHYTAWASGGGTLLDNWDWYHDLVGAKSVNHPENPAVFNADVVLPNTEHPLVDGLPERHQRADEWYDWVVNPANDVRVLVEVDTDTYASGQSRNGTLHPMTWCQDYDGGRSWFTSLGHAGGMWSEDYMQTMLRNGLEYATGLVEADCSPRSADEVGAWSDVIPWSLMPINAALTAEGKVQTFGSVIPQSSPANPDDWSGNPSIHQGGQFEIDIWDPSQERTQDTRFEGVVPNTTYTDLFCAIQVNDPNRRTMLTMGGDDGLGGNAPNEAAIGVTSWSEREGLQNEAPMKYPRWYPTSTVMPNGDIVVQGGSLYGGPGGPGATTPELYTPEEGNGWKSLEGATSSTAYSANENRWWYPRAFVSPEGDLYNITGTVHYSLDPYADDGEGELTMRGQLPADVRSQGDLGNPVGATSTATMYAPGKILQVGGGHWQNGGGPAGARAGFTVDLTSGEPEFAASEPMRHGRHWADSTVLPDGKVFVSGGSRANTALGGIATTPEIWDPETGQWESDLAVAQRHRLYHSTALLLPDGRVMTAGGGAPGPHNYANAEFYSPAYLFDGDEPAERPEITSAPSEIGYDGAFDVGVSEEIDRVTLVRSGSVTHSFNNDQRFQELDFVATGDRQITVNAPENANDAPPGTYLLFVWNEDGTPSIADLVQIDPEVDNDHRTPIVVDQFEYPRIPTSWASGTYPANVEVEPGNARMAPWVVDSTVRLVRGLQSGLGGLGKTGTHLDLGEDGEVHRTLTGLRPGAEYRIALRYGRDGRVNVPSDGVVSAEVSVADLEDTIVAGPDVASNSNSITSGTYVETFTASSSSEMLRFAASGTSAGVLIDDLVIFAQEPGLDDAPVYYAFDEGEGTTSANLGADRSVGSAVLTGGTGWSQEDGGVYGTAVDLPGGDRENAVDLPDDLLRDEENFTVSLWVEPDSFSNWMGLFHIGTGLGDAGGFFQIQTRTQADGSTGLAATFKAPGQSLQERIYASPTQDITADQWNHVVFTREGSTGTLYLDGEAIASRDDLTIDMSDIGATENNWLGRNGYPDDAFDGRMDEVRLYEQALTEDDVEMLYVAGSELRTTTTIEVDPESPAPFGEPVTVTATVEASDGSDAAGTAALVVDGSVEGNAVTVEDGQAVFPPLELSPGERTFEVRFTGAEGFRDSTATVDYEVERPPPGEGIPIHYPFDEGEGRTAANVGSDPTFGDATLQGNAGWSEEGAPIHDGPAVNLPGGSSGAGNQVNLPDDLTVGMNDEFTVSLWTRPRSQPNWVPLLQIGSSTDTFFLLQSSLQTSPGGFGATFKAPGNPSQERLQLGRNLPNNEWTHVVFTMRGSTGKIYWNGELEGQRDDFTISIDDVGVNGTTTANYLGSTSWPDPTWNGVVDDLRIYNHELSEEDVLELFEGEPPVEGETSIEATAEEIDLGQDAEVVATVTPSEATGTVEVRDEDDDVLGTGDLDEGTTTVTIDGDQLEAGEHTLEVNYLGGEGFAPSSTTVELVVTEVPDELDGAPVYYAFDEGEGSRSANLGSDRSVRSAHLRGDTGWTADGVFGAAVDLPGGGSTSGNFVELPDGLLGDAEDFAVSLWAHPRARPDWMPLLQIGNGTSTYFTLQSNLQTSGGGFGATFKAEIDGDEEEERLLTGSDNDLPLDAWTHVVFTMEDNVGTIYFDGEEVTSRTFPFGMPAVGDGEVTTDNYLGNNSWPDDMFDGLLDEVRLFERSLSAEEVAQLFEGEPPVEDVETSVEATAEAIELGQDAEVVATVTPSEATGTVEVRNEGGELLGTAELVDARAAVTITADALAVGAYTLEVDYLGADGFLPSSTTVELVVNEPDDQLTETSIEATAAAIELGQDGVVVATVTPSEATGIVEVRDEDGDVLGTGELDDGEATITVPAEDVRVGDNTLTVEYLRTEAFERSSTTVVLTVTEPPVEDVETSVEASAQAYEFGTEGAVAATVTPSEATGTVEVSDGDTVLGSADLSEGAVTVTFDGEALEVGTHTLDVDYLGADGFLPSSTTVQVTVTERDDEVPPPAGPACEPSDLDRNRFGDLRGSAHENNALCLAALGLAQGIGDGSNFGPRLDVTRGQMASFIARFIEDATGEQLQPGRSFSDVHSSYAHAENIRKLAGIGVTQGTSVSGGEQFAPLQNVSRGQMASFISRAMSYIATGDATPETVPPRTATDHFPDDDGSLHESNINALAQVEIVAGFTDGNYRWAAPVKRDQMASFVIRSYDYLLAEGLVTR
jgi:large repetitive protein